MSSRNGIGPRVAQPPPTAYEKTGGPGTFRRAGRPEAELPRQRDPRFFAVLLGLLGLSAAVALAAPSPTRASALLAAGRDGPTCPTWPSATVLASPRPTVSGVDCARPKPSPSPTDGVEAGKPLPRIAAEPGQPVVAATSSRLTGSTVTMTGLQFEGVVALPTADGTLTALKFSMDQAVIDDFLLRTPGPAGRTIRLATDRLTVSGDVAFYTTRFVGRLSGTEITLAPDLPLPDGISITSPIPTTFADPAIDLAFVNSDLLTARPKLKLTLG